MRMHERPAIRAPAVVERQVRALPQVQIEP